MTPPGLECDNWGAGNWIQGRRSGQSAESQECNWVQEGHWEPLLLHRQLGEPVHKPDVSQVKRVDVCETWPGLISYTRARPISDVPHTPCGETAPLRAHATRKSPGSDPRWWTRLTDLQCPITNFPIHMLPYPPYKLRAPDSSTVLVDGKCLVLKVIVHGDVETCGRKLDVKELNSLDMYMKRCKHGMHCSARAAALRCELSKAGNGPHAKEMATELSKIASDAMQLLRKLERIQSSRKQKTVS